MGFTNSSLVEYTKLSPNHSGQRRYSINRITPHCVVGQCTAEGLGSWFEKTSTQASSNYGIDRDGRVGMYVEEKNRSWCSSNGENDNRAVTIECASDSTDPYMMNATVYRMLIKLCADICRRNGKRKLLWLGDKAKTLAYSPAPDEMVLTVHRWFANKACPGQWLLDRMGDLAAKVTEELSGTATAPVIDPPESFVDLETERIHVVTKGETLWGISRQYFGAGQRYAAIRSLNGLTSNTIYPGQKLRIPKKGNDSDY